jgi:hypothetical protein
MRNIAKNYPQSSDGAACTCVVTEFRHTDDAHTGPFTIEAEFMTTVEMKELLEELLLNFRQFYVPSAYRELVGDEARRQCRDAAERAWETFQSLFSSQPRLTMEFLSEDRDEAHDKILYELERWAYAGLTHRPGGTDALDYSAIAGDLRECKEQLDMLTADHQRGSHPAFWPFIKLIRSVLLSSCQKLPMLKISGFTSVRLFYELD